MKNKEIVIKRLNYLIGHLQGVKKMVIEDRYCIDIIQQNLGVISALKKVNDRILSNHFETCVEKTITNGRIKDKKKILDEIKILFTKK